MLNLSSGSWMHVTANHDVMQVTGTSLNLSICIVMTSFLHADSHQVAAPSDNSALLPVQPIPRWLDQVLDYIVSLLTNENIHLSQDQLQPIFVFVKRVTDLCDNSAAMEGECCSGPI